MLLALVPLARARITELSAAHHTRQLSATAAGRFYPYIQFHRHVGVKVAQQTKCPLVLSVDDYAVGSKLRRLRSIAHFTRFS
jgi:hypothetical protein